MDYFNYSRRKANEVYVGATPMGGANPIRIQSMTNTVTMDTEACVEQAKRIIDAGGEYVRLTTQGVREAENLKNINIGLRSQGPHIQKSGIYRRGICSGDTENTRTLCEIPEYLQGESHSNTHRSEPRFFVGPYHVTLWRYSCRHGGIMYGIPAYLRRRGFHRCSHLHKSLEHCRNGENSKIAC